MALGPMSTKSKDVIFAVSKYAEGWMRAPKRVKNTFSSAHPRRLSRNSKFAHDTSLQRQGETEKLEKFTVEETQETKEIKRSQKNTQNTRNTRNRNKQRDIGKRKRGGGQKRKGGRRRRRRPVDEPPAEVIEGSEAVGSLSSASQHQPLEDDDGQEELEAVEQVSGREDDEGGGEIVGVEDQAEETPGSQQGYHQHPACTQTQSHLQHRGGQQQRLQLRQLLRLQVAHCLPLSWVSFFFPCFFSSRPVLPTLQVSCLVHSFPTILAYQTVGGIF
jgi:hypothetical protein